MSLNIEFHEKMTWIYLCIVLRLE